MNWKGNALCRIFRLEAFTVGEEDTLQSGICAERPKRSAKDEADLNLQHGIKIIA